jgi:hypothetical protein
LSSNQVTEFLAPHIIIQLLTRLFHQASQV